MKKNKLPIASIAQYKLPVFKIRGRCSGSGIECKFYRRSKTSKKGYKIYETLDEARMARKKQRKAHRKRLAPKAGRLFVALMGKRSDTIGYGYETQIAKRPGSKFFSAHYEMLEAQLNKDGINYWDITPYNCGRIGNKLVVVDWGCASCSSC